MFYVIKEGQENSILGSSIILEDFSYLMQDNYELIMTKIVKGAKLFGLINVPENIIDLTVEVVLYDKNMNYLVDGLNRNKVPLYSLIMNGVKIHKKQYENLKKLKNSDEIVIECNRDNFIKGLELAKYLNKKILIDGKSITLSDYYNLLAGYDFGSLDGFDIKVCYQEQNSEISVKELYDTANAIDGISREVERYNLSPFEKIIYVYDKVKSREYKKSDDAFVSRDLDKVLKGDSIVCVGFSNLFNAVLRSIGINAMPLISYEKLHQCSLVYVKDDKHNIDGVYVFDPTNDSKKSDDYIDNYNYFGLRMSDVKNSHVNDVYGFTTMDFYDILKLYNDDIGNSIEVNKFERLFDFIGENRSEDFFEMICYYQFMSSEKRKLLLEIYRNFITKYNPKEIPVDIFMNALCNTRMIEYYNDVTQDFDIDNIRKIVLFNRSRQKFRFSLNDDILSRMFETINYELEIDDILNEMSLEEIKFQERKKMNIKLLKVLKNIHKSN